MPDPITNNQGAGGDDFGHSDKSMHKKKDQEGGRGPGVSGDFVKSGEKSKEKVIEKWEEINKKVSKEDREEIKNDVRDSDYKPEKKDSEVLEEGINPFTKPLEEEDFEDEDLEDDVPVVPSGPAFVDKSESSVDNVEVVEVKQRGSNNESKEGLDVIEQGGDFDEQPQVDEFTEDLWDILAQAGVTKKRIMWFFIIVVVGFLLFWFFVLRGPSPVRVTDSGENDVVVENTNNDGKVNDSQSVEAVQSIGTEFVDSAKNGISDSINTVLLLGSEYNSDKIRYVRYITVLRDLQNVYEVDIYDLLDQSVDRRTTMERHLAEMQALIAEGESIFSDINVIMINLDGAYANVVGERDLYEQQFFNSAEALYGEQAYTNLGAFVETSQDVAEIRAYYNAYKVLRDMYVNSINVLRPRYDDILVNQEAIIKGIRVFDVPGSDIDAIIRLSF